MLEYIFYYENSRLVKGEKPTIHPKTPSFPLNNL
jgi:hypothetical protein